MAMDGFSAFGDGVSGILAARAADEECALRKE
jgi:hypothetical protein